MNIRYRIVTCGYTDEQKWRSKGAHFSKIRCKSPQNSNCSATGISVKFWMLQMFLSSLTAPLNPGSRHLVEVLKSSLQGNRQMFAFLISSSCLNAYHQIHNVECHSKLSPLTPVTFAFTLRSTLISFKNIHQNFVHSFCMNINGSPTQSSSSHNCIKYF